MFKVVEKLQLLYDMNRKANQNEAIDKEQNQTQTIIPKFTPNWVSVVRFDRLVINVSDCEYDVVPKVAKKLKWKVKSDTGNPQWDVWWTDWAITPQTLMKMQHHQKINHFPGMYTLSRKNLLAKNLMKMRKKNADEYNYFPLTWNIPSDYQQFRNYFESKPKGKARTFIVKPQCMSQGKGIFLTRKLEDINPQQHSVVQRYLSRPYLIDGLKFDLRIYVLLAGVDPLRIFIYKQGLARFATQNYVAPNRQNMQDVCMHLTNYAINKNNQNFVFNQDVNNMNVGHKRSLQAVFTLMKQRGVDTDTLQENIRQIIVKTIISGLSHLKFQYRTSQPQNYRGDMCFQLLGFDVIINEDLQPFLLQINYTPSFSTDTPLDVLIKSSLINDTLILMGTNKQFKQDMVKQRKQVRDQRMKTGKKLKLSQQQKDQRRKQAMIARDAYIDQHLGGFTKIFPLPEDHPRQIAYQQLIKLEIQASGNSAMSESKKSTKEEEKPMARRNTQKTNKLPSISSIKEAALQNSKKLLVSKRVTELSALRIQDENIKNNQTRHESAHNLLKKIKVRQASISKRTPLTRQTLVPKTVQFQGGRFDGLGQCYRNQHCE